MVFLKAQIHSEAPYDFLNFFCKCPPVNPEIIYHSHPSKYICLYTNPAAISQFHSVQNREKEKKREREREREFEVIACYPFKNRRPVSFYKVTIQRIFPFFATHAEVKRPKMFTLKSDISQHMGELYDHASCL